MLYIYLFFKIPEKKSMNFDYPWFHPAWLGEILWQKKVLKSNVQFTNYLHKHLALTNGELIA